MQQLLPALHEGRLLEVLADTEPSVELQVGGSAGVFPCTGFPTGLVTLVS